jgi:glycosyltransferase involved in cell wall biosynthesis
LKIVYCTGALYNPGGAERVLINKANYLADIANYEVWIITADQRAKPFCFPLNKKIKFVDASIHRLIPKRVIPLVTKKRLLPKIVKHYQSIIDEIQPDIIIVNELGFDDEIIPMLNSSAKKIREFHSSHEAVKMMIAAKKDWKSRLQSSYVNQQSYRQFNKFDCVVLLTESDRKEAHYGTLTEVIPNTLSKPKIGCSRLEERKVITVGRLDNLKNHIAQIEVWAGVVRDYPNWSLHMYGEGPEKKRLQQTIVDRGLENNVFLEGLCTDINKEYQNSSLFLFTSLAEGFGMVLIEAMSLGLPCISYDCPCGPSEIIDNGVNGWLIPIGDTKMLLEKTKELIENSEMRIKMGRAAYEKSKYYFPENIMPRWQKLFNKLVEDKL